MTNCVCDSTKDKGFGQIKFIERGEFAPRGNPPEGANRNLCYNKTMKRRLGIFDIDGTVFRSSLLIEFTNGLINEGSFPARARKEIEADYFAWLDRKGHYDTYIKRVVAIHAKYLRGLAEREVERVVHRVINEQKDRVYRFTRDLIAELRRKKFYLVAVSGSSHHIVPHFAKHFGFQTSYGSLYEVKKGVFTGKTLRENQAQTKVAILEQLLYDKGIDVDWKHSVAVGDTESDAPLLELVGRPIAFNPNRILADEARRRGWEIIVERKDVIYRVKDFEFIPYCP